MEEPDVVVHEGPGEHDASRGLACSLEELGIKAPFVLASTHGATLSASLTGAGPPETSPDDADQTWAARLGIRAKQAGADAVVAVGGGRCLDIGKLAAARAGLVLIVVPTQLSHDGICSPVAVVPDETGRAQSIGAVQPRAVFLSLPTLAGAPPRSVASGLGDLLANPLALRDWALAAEHGLEEVNGDAWDLSVRSFELIEPFLDLDPARSAPDPAFLRTLADALILSGLAMIRSGSSRPASGGEHEVSHAIDHLFPGRAMHGEQVAFGCLVSAALYGEDTDALRARLEVLGLPSHPADMGLSHDDVVKILLEAPDTRPGRFTIIEEAALDGASARRLVDRLWTDR